MSETNDQNPQYPSQLTPCESNSSSPVIDNSILREPGDAPNSHRVMIVTAAAGALTAAMILAGWGMKIERNEAEILRAGLSAATAQPYKRFSFFRQIDDGRDAVITDAAVSFVEVNQNDEAQNNEEQAQQTIRVEQLKFLNEQLRKYAQKRVKLQRIMLKLRALEIKRKQQERNSQDESGFAGTQLTEDAQYRTRLREAAKLRDELRQLRRESLATPSYANQPQPPHQSTSSRSFRSELQRSEAAQLNDNNIPRIAIMVNDNISSQTSARDITRPDLRNMPINKRAQYHTSRLIARLEETRLDVTTRLTAVTWSDNGPVR